MSAEQHPSAGGLVLRVVRRRSLVEMTCAPAFMRANQDSYLDECPQCHQQVIVSAAARGVVMGVIKADTLREGEDRIIQTTPRPIILVCDVCAPCSVPKIDPKMFVHPTNGKRNS